MVMVIIGLFPHHYYELKCILFSERRGIASGGGYVTSIYSGLTVMQYVFLNRKLYSIQLWSKVTL